MAQLSLKRILDSAKNCPVKGRWYMYESYKRKVQDLELSSEEYLEACRKLAQYLEV